MEFIRKHYAVTPGGGGGNPGNNPANSAKQAADAIDELKESVAGLKDAFTTIGQAIKREIVDNIQNADDATRDLGKVLANNVNSALRSMGNNSQEILSNFEALVDGSLKSANVEKQMAAAARKRAKAENDIAIALDNGVISQGEALKRALQLEEVYTEQRSILAAQQLIAMKTEKTMGNLGKVFTGLAKVPIVGKLIDAEKVLQRMQKAAAEGAGKWKTFGVGIQETFASIGQSLTDPVTIITGLVTGFVKLVKLAAEYQSKQFEAAKDLGVSVKRGQELRNNFVALARANLGLGVTADQLQKSYAGVQNELGIIVKQSDEFNLTTTLIERRTGATAEHMATLQFAAKKSGALLSDAYTSIIGSAKAEGARVKLAMSEKQILEGISKVSANIYQNFKGNYKQIAAAVVEAKKLGTTLDQINGIQDQFLDFESSIQKEFEAEVLTGKEMNLTRARYLALTHDTKGLMVEINKLVGSASEFNKLDTISQNSKAEALGMSRETISKMLMDQEKMNALGEAAGADLQTQYDLLIKQGMKRQDIVNVLGQEATQSAYMASVSEKLAATMDAIKNTIAQSAAKLLPMVESIVNFVANAENLKKIFITISAILGGMVGYSLAMKAAGTAQAATQLSILQTIAAQNVVLQQAAIKQAQLAEVAIVEATAKSTAGAGFLGPGALAVGAAVFTGLMAYLATTGMGGGSSTSMPTPSYDIPNAITPMGPAATYTPPASTSTASTAGTSVGTGQGAGDVYLDGEKVGYLVMRGSKKSYGLDKA